MADILAFNSVTGKEQSVTQAQLNLFPHTLHRVDIVNRAGKPAKPKPPTIKRVADEQPLAEAQPSVEDVTSERQNPWQP